MFITDFVLCLQAREDIIGLLKSDRTKPETLEAHYGSSVPIKPLQALQRDAVLTRSSNSTEDVYEIPMAEVKNKYALIFVFLIPFMFFWLSITTKTV